MKTLLVTLLTLATSTAFAAEARPLGLVCSNSYVISDGANGESPFDNIPKVIVDLKQQGNEPSFVAEATQTTTDGRYEFGMRAFRYQLANSKKWQTRISLRITDNVNKLSYSSLDFIDSSVARLTIQSTDEKLRDSFWVNSDCELQ